MIKYDIMWKLSWAINCGGYSLFIHISFCCWFANVDSDDPHFTRYRVQVFWLIQLLTEDGAMPDSMAQSLAYASHPTMEQSAPGGFPEFREIPLGKVSKTPGTETFCWGLHGREFSEKLAEKVNGKGGYPPSPLNERSVAENEIFFRRKRKFLPKNHCFWANFLWFFS